MLRRVTFTVLPAVARLSCCLRLKPLSALLFLIFSVCLSFVCLHPPVLLHPVGCQDPYFNEPAVELMRGTSEGAIASMRFVDRQLHCLQSFPSCHVSTQPPQHLRHKQTLRKLASCLLCLYPSSTRTMSHWYPGGLCVCFAVVLGVLPPSPSAM